MKNWLAKLFGRTNRSQERDSDATFPIPWEGQRQSIYRFLSHYTQGSEPLPESAQTLPDENTQQGELRWVAGGMDGAFGHHGGSAVAEATADKILEALGAAANTPSLENVQRLYGLLRDEPTIDYIDGLIEKLPHERAISAQNVHDLMQWLARESPDRSPVKCAIALLAFFPSEENKRLLSTLALHEEFTLYCAVALVNILPVELHESELVALAKRVTGWGRIHLIERLPFEVSATTREWLLREGYANSVMVEYTAWDCATKGQLLNRLVSGNVDSELRLGAGEILGALINGGPARGIFDYTDGARACQCYVELVQQSAGDDLRDFLFTHAIVDFVSDSEYSWEEWSDKGWSEAIRQQIITVAQSVQSEPKWREKVNSALAGSNKLDFYLTVRAAKILGIDTWDVIFSRQSASAQENNWYELMQTSDPKRLEKILSLAESQFDLGAIARGPGTQLGIGPDYVQHGALDFILQDLKRFPGQGWTLIKAGLQSPVIRNRHMALNAMETWSSELITQEQRNVLADALRLEPDAKISERLKQALENL